MSNHLFLFTIGPVQSFIAQARKTQDLYAGSALLFDLINFALSYTECQGHKIIFPFYDKNKICFDIERTEENHSYPNRFVALLNTDNQDKVKILGQSLENLVKNKLEDLATDKFKIIPAQSRPSGLCEQIKDFLEIYWTAIPYDETNDDYAKKFKELEQYLGAVKNVRSFRQLSETGRKCSVNGEYNVKVYRKTEEEEKANKGNTERSRAKIRATKLYANDNYIIDNNYNDIKLRHLQKGEGLCSISFLKRLYKDKDKENEEENFPSTAKIALLNFWNDGKIKPLITDFKKLFKEGTFDQELLFEDNITKEYFKKNGVEPSDDRTLEEAQKQQRKIFDKAKELKLKPSKYYALLSFDGDSMGKWLSKATSDSQHNDFSKLLIDFAKKATEIVDKNGKTVYAGGDDFLGFVNLQGLFETIENLKKVFDTEVTKKVKIKNGSKDFTMSMGVVIAHYKMPLQKIIKLNHVLLKETKKTVSDKNGIGVSFLKKSGFIGKVITKNDNIELLKSVLDAIKNKTFNSRMVYPFAKTFALWNDNKFEQGKLEIQMALLQTEFLRLMLKNVSKEHKLSMEKLNKNMFSNLITVENNSINLSNLIGAIRLLEGLNAEI